jgi:hypothetical protein
MHDHDGLQYFGDLDDSYHLDNDTMETNRSR